MIGGGTNLIVDDRGFAGVITRYVANALEIDGTTVRVEAGAVLQDLVDGTAVLRRFANLETMTSIKRWISGAPSTAMPEPTATPSRNRSKASAFSMARKPANYSPTS